MINQWATVTPNSTPANGPGGNQIVPTPVTTNDWPKMLLAIAILGGGVWVVSEMFSDDAAKWLALGLVAAIITWYETHGQKFTSELNNIMSVIKGA